MQVLIKAILSLIIILSATGVARKFPSLGGLIAVMPLTGALVLSWVYVENRGSTDTVQVFAKSAFWGILPTMLFFLAAFICFRRHYSLPATLVISFLAWGAAALVHHMILK